MIVVTGANGFIGRALIHKLNAQNFRALIAVDHFDGQARYEAPTAAVVQEYIDWDDLISWLDSKQQTIEFIFHVGTYMAKANRSTPTLEGHIAYSMKLWEQCARLYIPLIYTSSSAVYGMGEKGFSEEIPGETLHPVNALGRALLNFDNWVLQQKKAPFYWAGLRLFTVYGPGEWLHGSRGSDICCLFKDIRTKGIVSVCRVKRSLYQKDVHMQDLIYVKDVVDVCYFLMHHRKNPGLYNVGSGKATSSTHVAKILFQLLGLKEAIRYINPSSNMQILRPSVVEASIEKLRQTGFVAPFHTPEEGIRDYVNNFLMHDL